MPTRSFTVRMDKCDCDIAADAMAAVFNTATDPQQYVAICEVRVAPQAINDDTTNVLGNQGIMALERITAASGGTELTALKYDTGASSLPSQIKCRQHPTSITISGGTLRRFGDVMSTPSVTQSVSFQAMIRAPGIVDANDHSGRTAEGQDIWHADGVSDTEPIVLREGEGIALVRRAWGVPQAMHLGLVVKVVSTGNIYRWFDGDFGTSDELDMANLSLMNESGSGIVLQVYVVTFPSLGESNIPRYRLVRTETVFQSNRTGESISLTKHDTSATITGVECYRGPMLLLAHANGEGAQVQYHDYQTTLAPTATQQKADTLRAWSGAGPYIRTTSAPNINWDMLSRGEPEVWPGDRRGVGAGLDFPILLRMGEGLAIIGGGNGAIETSEQAYLNVEFCGYVYTPNAVYPNENDVELNVVYGPNGNDYSGDFVVPAEADVKISVQYGADGTEFTGEYTGGGGGNTYSRGRVVNG